MDNFLRVAALFSTSCDDSARTARRKHVLAAKLSATILWRVAGDALLLKHHRGLLWAVRFIAPIVSDRLVFSAAPLSRFAAASCACGAERRRAGRRTAGISIDIGRACGARYLPLPYLKAHFACTYPHCLTRTRKGDATLTAPPLCCWR